MQKGIYPFWIHEILGESWWNFINRKRFLQKYKCGNTTDSDSLHKKQDWTLKKLTEYHDLYVQGDKLSLADVFDNFPVMCLVSEIFFFWSMCLFLFSYCMHHGQHASSLKKTKVKVDPLNDVFNGTKRYYKMNLSRKSSTWNITIKIKNQHIIW